jgi:hypothetical protein
MRSGLIGLLMRCEVDRQEAVRRAAIKASNLRQWRRWRQFYKEAEGKAGKLPRDVRVLMQVKNEYFCAAAVWERVSGVWSCVEAAPILGWMVGMNKDKAKVELLKRGCTWERVGAA